MKHAKVLFLSLAFALSVPVSAQMLPEIPMDPAIRYGKLANGLTYYIRHNDLPENRANFYIAQKVGSVQEEEEQRGLAHFLEHMCFNGTENFPENSLIEYCERIGVKFGQNLNAYTSTDETVYNIDDVPVTETNIDSCLLILRDWADGLTLAGEEIDKERGVIHEEWRLRSSAQSRIFERNLPELFPGSRYGERFPIGLMSVIDNFKYEELRAYYEKWYRPDLQGIIVVGDIDVDAVESKIQALFSPITLPDNPAKYELYPVPDNEEAIYIIDKDKEQTSTVLNLAFKHEPLPENYKNTQAYFALEYLTQMATSALNARLDELSQKADCPFNMAICYDDNFLGMSKTMDAFTIGILPKPGLDKEAVEAVMKELKRAAEFGFTGTELFRCGEEFISRLEKIYDNRDKQKNGFYTRQYVRHFLEAEPIPDIETEFNLYKTIHTQLSSQGVLVPAVGEVFKDYTASTQKNFVFLGMYPEQETVAVPTVEDMKQAVAAGLAAEVEAYVDNVKDEPLVPILPEKGNIEKEEESDFGFTCWTLENGARVYFKQTDFNDSEVIFNASSFGGQSKIGDDDLVNMFLFEQVVGNTGLGNFTATELQKKLAGKQVSCNVSLDSSREFLQGSSTPKDLRTLFELIYLRFTEPADDPDGYANCLSMMHTQLENIDKNPMAAFSDSLLATYYDHNPRRGRLHLADLEQADYEAIKRIYKERYNAGGDFDFFFTGAFNVDSLRAYTEQFIAPLPGVTSRESYVDLHLYPTEGVQNNHFSREMETPKAYIVQMWSGTAPYSLKQKAVVEAFGSILTQRYLKSIREDAGIAYSVGATGNANYVLREDYEVQIYCPVQPAGRDSALLLMRQEIEQIAEQGVTAEELDKFLQFELKDYADSQKKNSYWMNLITSKVCWGRDKRTGYEEALKSVTSDDIRNFVKDILLAQSNCCTVSMLPADFTE